MRLYEIALFILAFNFSAFVLASTGIFHTTIPMTTDVSAYQKERLDIATKSLTPSSQIGLLDAVLGSAWFMIQGFGLLISVFIESTVGLPLMLASYPFYLPSYLVAAISAMQIVVYIAGLAQFLRGYEVGA